MKVSKHTKLTLEFEQKRHFARKTRPLMLFIHRQGHKVLIKFKNQIQLVLRASLP